MLEMISALSGNIFLNLAISFSLNYCVFLMSDAPRPFSQFQAIRHPPLLWLFLEIPIHWNSQTSDLANLEVNFDCGKPWLDLVWHPI